MQNLNLGLDLDLKAGHPALEFTNTVSNHASEHPGETLFSYEDLLSWGKKVGLLRKEQVEMLSRKATNQSQEAEAIFEKSIKLREALYRIFVARTKDNSPVNDDMMVLNSILEHLTNGAQIVHQAGEFEWQWNLDKDALDAPLYLIALSAVNLMTSEHQHRVGQCADEDGCGWLFVDTSKNHSRRWCDINDCGNRAKQRRYQKRAKKQKS